MDGPHAGGWALGPVAKAEPGRVATYLSTLRLEDSMWNKGLREWHLGSYVAGRRNRQRTSWGQANSSSKPDLPSLIM